MWNLSSTAIFMDMLTEEKMIIYILNSGIGAMILWQFITEDTHRRTLALPLFGSATALCGLLVEKVFAAKQEQLWKHQEGATLNHSILNDPEDARRLWKQHFTHLAQHPSLAATETGQCHFVVTASSPPHLGPLLATSIPSLPSHTLHMGTHPPSPARKITRPLGALCQVPPWLRSHLPSSKSYKPKNQKCRTPDVGKKGGGGGKLQCLPSPLGVALRCAGKHEAFQDAGLTPRNVLMNVGTCARVAISNLSASVPAYAIPSKSGKVQRAGYWYEISVPLHFCISIHSSKQHLVSRTGRAREAGITRLLCSLLQRHCHKLPI